MIKFKEFIKEIKVFISQNPKRVKFIGLIVMIIALPLIVVSALTIQNLQQKASESAEGVTITDAKGSILNVTSNRDIFISINLPSDWITPDEQSSNNLINNVYA